uniref:Putative secreted protein n=1 Tax=Anopheles triannulatus TaxID=58253 RepID=A0A2M4B1B1_9DIPT
MVAFSLPATLSAPAQTESACVCIGKSLFFCPAPLPLSPSLPSPYSSVTWSSLMALNSKLEFFVECAWRRCIPKSPNLAVTNGNGNCMAASHCFRACGATPPKTPHMPKP